MFTRHLKQLAITTRVGLPQAQQTRTSINIKLRTKGMSLEEYESQKGATAVDRPWSPHVTIYKFPVPALASITHRITDVALTGIFGTIGLATLTVGPTELPLLIEAFKTSFPLLMPLLKFCISFPLSFHALTGVRHLVIFCFM